MNFKPILIILMMLPTISFAQSDLENALKLSQVLLSGFSVAKAAKGSNKDSKTISSVCIKNRMQEKISVTLTGKDADGVLLTKVLIVQNDGKECVFNILKGIYAYEVLLSNKEIYKKGEYSFDDDVVITIKREN